MIRINDNGDLVAQVPDKRFNRSMITRKLATAAELKAAYAERGMVVVPREPTEAMLEAAESMYCTGSLDTAPPTTAAIYRAMLQAAIKEAP